MDAKLSVLISSKAGALYCRFRSPVQWSPQGSQLKSRLWQPTALHWPSCDAGNTSQSTEGFSFYFYFLQNPTQHFESSYSRLLSIGSLLLNHRASTLIIFHWLAAGESGFTPCYGEKEWVLTSFPPLIRWRAKWQGHRGAGGDASVYFKGNTLRWNFLHTIACRDQTQRLPVFHPTIEFVSALRVRLFFSH